MRLMAAVDEQIYQALLPGAPMERFDEFMALTAEAEYRNIDRYHGAFDGVPQMIRQLSEADIFLPCAPTAPMVMCVKLRPRWGWRPILPGCRERNRGCTKSDTLKMVLDKIRPDKAVMVGNAITTCRRFGTTGCRLSAVNTAICPMRWTARTFEWPAPRISPSRKGIDRRIGCKKQEEAAWRHIES